ncbi:hypothetical protein K1719_021820 [Acacia pycnantha]|nr:hypothetical protein K1719_021820 [Acacia pycnantha]
MKMESFTTSTSTTVLDDSATNGHDSGVDHSSGIEENKRWSRRSGLWWRSRTVLEVAVVKLFIWSEERSEKKRMR